VEFAIGFIAYVDATNGNSPLCGHEENAERSGDEEKSDDSNLDLWPDCRLIVVLESCSNNQHRIDHSGMGSSWGTKWILLDKGPIPPKREQL
jgi:hypothetical protein